MRKVGYWDWDRMMERRTNFSSMGKSKNATPSVMTAWVSSSGMPTFLRYRNPTSRRAWRRSVRNWGLVEGSLASERSRMGIVLKDIILAYKEGKRFRHEDLYSEEVKEKWCERALGVISRWRNYPTSAPHPSLHVIRREPQMMELVGSNLDLHFNRALRLFNRSGRNASISWFEVFQNFEHLGSESFNLSESDRAIEPEYRASAWPAH